MSDDLSTNAVPEPRAGRDLEGQRILDRLRTTMFGVDNGPTRIGRWQLLRKLGKGAMGTVYAAHDPELERQVAIKVLHGMDPDAEQVRRLRLRREAQAMARVQHVNLVQVYDVCVDAPQPYVVMELIEGETLRVWQGRPERNWRELIEAYVKVARGLAALHEAGIIHRDFKPDNALRSQDGRVRVVDFGLVAATASLDTDHAPRPPGLTRDGALVGTLNYMSPEQLRGERGDARLDQFSVCCSLFEAVYRVRPFVGSDPESRITEIHEGVKRPENPLGAPRRLFNTLARGFAEHPERRYLSMGALADALDRHLDRRRPRSVLLYASLLLVPLTAWLLLSDRSPCENIEQQLIDAWDPRQEAAIHEGFIAQDLQDAPEQWRGLSATMHEVRNRWIGLRQETCQARKQARPPLWVLQRDRCLDDLRALMTALARSYLAPTPTDIAAAGETAAMLGERLHQCARIDPQHLAPPPPDVTPRLTAALQEVTLEQSAGRLRRAEASARRALEIAEQSHVLAATAEARHSPSALARMDPPPLRRTDPPRSR